MKRARYFFIAVALSAGLVQAAEVSVADFDSRMAIAKSTVTNGVKWIDGKDLPIEGRVFDDVELYYDRLPAKAHVNGGVNHMKHFTAGEQVRFATDAKKLTFRWKPYSKELAGSNFSSQGRSGIDVYRYDAKRERWFHVASGAPQSFEKGGSLDVDWIPGEACLVNLPLYNGVTEFKLGIAPNACVTPPPPRKSGVTKPVVFYGTSITHGGCVSRPGMAFVNRVGRDLDVPVVNLGFSGCGHMEMEMTEHLSRIDASCYVLDCLWNMWGGEIERNYEPFIRKLRELKPNVPIVMAERCDMRYRADGTGDPNFVKDHAFVRALYEKLLKEGWKNLVYLPSSKQQYVGDGDGTVDTCHPNDYGMMQMAKGFGDAVAEALVGNGTLRRK